MHILIRISLNLKAGVAKNPVLELMNGVFFFKCHVISTRDDIRSKVKENHSTYFHCGPSRTDRMTSGRKTLKFHKMTENYLFKYQR